MNIETTSKFYKILMAEFYLDQYFNFSWDLGSKVILYKNSLHLHTPH